MMLARQIKELKAEQEADMRTLRLQADALWQVISPRNVVQNHPFMCIGTAIALGMTIAPSPGKGKSSKSDGGGAFQLVKRILGHFMGGQGGPSEAEAAKAVREPPANTPAASPVTEVVHGVQLLLSALDRFGFGGSGSGPEIIVCDAGSVRGAQTPFNFE